MKNSKTNMVICTINIVLGNGCGRFEFVEGKRYKKSSLTSDCRLQKNQILKYFKESFY